MAQNNDYYKTLGVNRDASLDEIKKAYRQLARKYHPDFNKGDKNAESKFKDISEAYAVISNPEARKQYDQFGHMGGGQQARGFDFSGFDFGDFFQAFGREGRGFEDLRGGGAFSGFGDMFADIFGGRASAGRRQGGFAPGQDLLYELELNLVDAARGTSTHVTLNTPTGQEGITVKIPAGVRTGSKVRVTGKGAKGIGGAPAGNLYMVIKVRKHPFFDRRGHNLHCELPVTVGEAALGAKIHVPTIEGSTTMTLPPGTQGGQKFRLKGKGIQRLKGEGRGDLYVTVRIVLPRTPDEKSKELISEFETRNPGNPRDGIKV